MPAENTFLPHCAAIKSHSVFPPSLYKYVLAAANSMLSPPRCLNPIQAPALLWFAMVHGESELGPELWWLEGAGLCCQGAVMALPS